MDSPSQFVIYGANGWMGRSAVEFLSLIEPEIADERLLLIGSRPSELVINGSNFKVLDPGSGFSYIEENSVFLNSAFLRREALMTISTQEYVRRNREISAFAMRTLEEKRLFSFINLSKLNETYLETINCFCLKSASGTQASQFSCCLQL